MLTLIAFLVCWGVLSLAMDSPVASFALSVAVALGVRWSVSRLRGQPEREEAAPTKPLPPATPKLVNQNPALLLPFDVPQLMRAGRWDEARLAMQKMAYTINREPAETQARFKLLMTTFARQDPLYKTGMELVHEIVAKEPGIRQTKLYPHLQPMSTEDARYVLYFAHELGDICRVKKGNSYLVYLPPDAPLIL